MTTLGRTKSALLVIDVQNQVVDGAYNKDRVVANINVAVGKARAAGVPVVWVQHSDEWMPIRSDDWQIVAELTPADGEARVGKLYRNSFEATDLESVLNKLDVGHVYVSGAQTNNCVRFTSHGALDRGYDVTLIKDAHTTTDYTFGDQVVPAEVLVRDLNASFSEEELPGRSASAANVADVFN
ncbi:PncA Amidases related to nicotinamidase [Candidatus Nanopelagicaceae bacterium]